MCACSDGGSTCIGAESGLSRRIHNQRRLITSAMAMEEAQQPRAWWGRQLTGE
jgi:hypothetical protein